MDVDELLRDLKQVREHGIPRTERNLARVPALEEALATRARALGVDSGQHYLRELIDEAAGQLDSHTAEGVRFALDTYGEGGSSAERRERFALHHDRSAETVRKNGLEEGALRELAKAILATHNASVAGSAEFADVVGCEHHSLYSSAQGRAVITSKARAYYAIDCFEQDLRQSVDRLLLHNASPAEVFDVEYEALAARRALDDTSVSSGLARYLHPREAYDVLLRHAARLPTDLVAHLRATIAPLDGFTPVRNRVMNGRPLHPDDLGDAGAFIALMRIGYFPQTAAAMDQMVLDAAWQPRPRAGSGPMERILHNLPAPDFDETGLLGRDQQSSAVVAMLKRGRDRMITLRGEGGIGKTALALDICYRLVDDPNPPFEAILWTSLKSERLTPDGVQQLANAVRDLDGATCALGRAIDPSFDGTAEELAEVLGEMNTLVVIDNLETINGSEVVRLWDALPATVTFLFTSRVGVGQFERHVDVGELEPASAELLLRKFARTREQMDLAGLPTSRLDEVLRQLRYSPLAIRWYVLSVEAGRAPSDVLRNQEELLKFCVQNVVETLTPNERTLLDVLQALGRPVPFEELAVISGIGVDALRRGAQRLSQCSLLVRSQFANVDDSEVLSLSSTARAYLPTAARQDVVDEVLRNEAAYKQERSQATVRRKFSVHAILERASSDAPVAVLLRRALSYYRSGHPDDASFTMGTARALNPLYFEVDRVDAYLASIQKESARATRLYRSSLEKCRTEAERAWVGFFYAVHLAQSGEIDDAIIWAERSHGFFHAAETALQLGRFLFWAKRFEDGQRLIEQAIKGSMDADGMITATTQLVECYRQWSEADLEKRLPGRALEHALDGTEAGLRCHLSGSTDDRLMRSIVDSVAVALKATRLLTDPNEAGESTLAGALRQLAGDSRFSLLPSWAQLARSGNSIASRLTPKNCAGIWRLRTGARSGGPEARSHYLSPRQLRVHFQPRIPKECVLPRRCAPGSAHDV